MLLVGLMNSDPSLKHCGYQRHFSKKGEERMDKYACQVCGYTYDPVKGDPENGVNPGTKFEDLAGDWVCPLCGAPKDMFEKVG